MLLLSFAVLSKCIFLIHEIYKDVKKSCQSSPILQPVLNMILLAGLCLCCFYYQHISVLEIHIYKEFVLQ